MLKRTMTYTDYDGNERTEDFYFNLTKAEILEMNLSKNGGLEAYVRKIMASQDIPTLVSLFKDLILRSYGEKSLDGKRFIKNDELKEAFMQTEAFSMLFMELATDANAASAFINGIVPKDVAEKAAELQRDNPDYSPKSIKA